MPPWRCSTGVSLVVSPGDRVGIVGPNGIGKSTLLRLLAGLEPPDRGTIVSSGEVGYLPQEPEATPGETVRGLLARRTGIAAAESELDGLASRLGGEPELAAAYSEALDRFLALGGEDFDGRARAVLSDVGLDGIADRDVASLSGGEIARASLAAILLARFDVFLLDEPTNNLDFDGLDRLERFLRGLARRRRARLARPRVPRPDRDAGRRDRGGDAAGARVRRHVVGLRGGARAGARRARSRLPRRTPTSATG